MKRPPGTSLTYGLVEALGHAIVAGEFDGGGFPTEARVAAQYGASRTVTREAVKMLTAKGLLSARPRHGTVIEPEAAWNLLDPDVLRWLLERKFSLGLLRQFTEIRLGIEPMAAALAARKANAEAIARIQAGLARMKAAADGADDPLAADVAFHVAILEATDNMFYRQLNELVNTALHISIRFTNRIAGRTASIPQHQEVLEAIVRRDSGAAEAGMRKLIVDVLALIESSPELDRGAA
jgi:DNA-binding FadR family transcriptional regulator